MGATAPRRLLPVFLITLLLILTTAYYVASLKDAVPSPRDLVSTVGDKLKGVSPNPEGTTEEEEWSGPSEDSTTSSSAPEATPAIFDSVPSLPSYHYEDAPTVQSEKGAGGMGTHYHIRPSTPSSPSLPIANCEYPILIHTTPDKHCTGVLALYASIVRNTLTQPEALRNKTCVHFTYVDPELKTIEEMYQWPARENPFPQVEDCRKLDSTPELNELVPVRWQALTPIEKPKKMVAGHANWLAALNKVHSWAFDLYPRVLILDADSFILTDLAEIFLEMPTDVTVSGAPDQFWNCQDRTRMNGGMILLGAPGRYFHTVMAELLHDPGASCMTGKWEQSEQELLNCFCGWTYGDRPVLHPPRPEFMCRMMPIYNSVWPKNYGCSDVNVKPIRSIHFTAVTKPWNVPEDKLDSRFDTLFFKCLRDNARSGTAQGLRDCVVPELEVTRLVNDKIPKPLRTATPGATATAAPDAGDEEAAEEEAPEEEAPAEETPAPEAAAETAAPERR